MKFNNLNFQSNNKYNLNLSFQHSMKKNLETSRFKFTMVDLTYTALEKKNLDWAEA